MAVISVTNDNTVATFVTKFNSVAAFVGDTSSLNTTAQNLAGGLDELHGEYDTYIATVGTKTDLNDAIEQSTIVASINDFYTDYTTAIGDLSFDNGGADITDAVDTNTTAIDALDTYTGNGITSISAGLAAAIDPDDLTAAVNYLFTVATTPTTVFSDPVTFNQTLETLGAATLASCTVNGNFTFNDTGSAAVSIILDEDNMVSDSDTALVTQQSLVAYIATQVASVDAVTLDGIDSSSFLRSDLDDEIANDVHVQWGDGTSGSVRLEHSSSGNSFALTPHNGTAFQSGQALSYDGDEDYWTFFDRLDVDGIFNVGGAFTSLGIDDNATSNKIQIENTLITAKTSLTVNGAVTLTSGNIGLPNGTTAHVSNSAGEKIEFDDSGNTISIEANFTKSADFTNTAATLYYAAAAKLATASDGVDITGTLDATGAFSATSGTFSADVTTSGDFTLPDEVAADLTNGAGELVRLNGSSTNTVQVFAGGVEGFEATSTAVALMYAGSEKLATTNTGVSVTGGIITTGDLQLPNTGVIHNNSTERIEFTTSTIIMDIGNTERFRVDNAGVDVTGAITATNGLTLSTGDLVLPNSGVIHNGSSERIEFTTSTIIMDIGGSEVTRTDSAGFDVTGAITATGNISAYSDRRLKNLKQPIKDPITKLRNLNGYEFHWTKEAQKSLNVSGDQQVGVVAQEVQKVLPEAVHEAPETNKLTVDYTKLVPLLIEAVNNLSYQLDELKKKVK